MKENVELCSQKLSEIFNFNFECCIRECFLTYDLSNIARNFIQLCKFIQYKLLYAKFYTNLKLFDMLLKLVNINDVQ